MNTRKRMKLVERQYAGQRDYWRDAQGNFYRYRAGDGVAHDPYIYQWHDPAHCQMHLLERLLKIDLFGPAGVEIVMNGFGGWIVRSRDDARIRMADYPFERTSVRQLRVEFKLIGQYSTRFPECSAVAKSCDDYGSPTGDWRAVCDFSTVAAINEFIEQIEGEFIRQKLVNPPKEKEGAL